MTNAPDFLRVAAVRTLGDPILTPGEARMLLALRERHGSPISAFELLEICPVKPRGPTPAKYPEAIFRVRAHHIRSKTYATAVRSEVGPFNPGYWLDEAMARSIDTVTGVLS